MHNSLLAFLGCHRRWFSRCRTSDGTQNRLGHAYPSTAGLGRGRRRERLGAFSLASVEGTLNRFSTEPAQKREPLSGRSGRCVYRSLGEKDYECPQVPYSRWSCINGSRLSHAALLEANFTGAHFR